MIGLDQIALEILVRIVDGAVERVVPDSPEKCGKTGGGCDSPPQYLQQPETPTEIENVYFETI